MKEPRNVRLSIKITSIQNFDVILIASCSNGTASTSESRLNDRTIIGPCTVQGLRLMPPLGRQSEYFLAVSFHSECDSDPCRMVSYDGDAKRGGCIEEPRVACHAVRVAGPARDVCSVADLGCCGGTRSGGHNGNPVCRAAT